MSVTGVPGRGAPRRGSRSWRRDRRVAADRTELTARVAELAGQMAELQESVTTLSGVLFGSSSEKGGSPSRRNGRSGLAARQRGSGGSGRAGLVTGGGISSHLETGTRPRCGCRRSGAAPSAASRLSSWHRGQRAGRLAGEDHPDRVAAAPLPAAVRLRGAPDGLRAGGAQPCRRGCSPRGSWRGWRMRSMCWAGRCTGSSRRWPPTGSTCAGHVVRGAEADRAADRAVGRGDRRARPDRRACACR